MAVGMSSAYYLVGAITLGVIQLVLSLEFASSRSMQSARRLFYATILYLPLLWIALLADHFRHL
jgi:heme O synthase-like polyprenyltransferase